MNMLKEIRISKNISQSCLAEATGLTHASISRYENGKRNMSVDTAMKIAKVLGVSWTSLFEGKEDGKKAI